MNTRPIYGPFPTWTDACRWMLAFVRAMNGAVPMVELVTPLLGIHRAIDLVEQFKVRGVIERDGGTLAAPLFRYTGRMFGAPLVDVV